MSKWTLYLIILFQTALVLWLATKIAIDRIPESKNLNGQPYTITHIWECWIDEPIQTYLDDRTKDFSIIHMSNFSSTIVIRNWDWSTSLCTPLYR